MKPSAIGEELAIFKPTPVMPVDIWQRLKLPASQGTRLRQAVESGLAFDALLLAQQELQVEQQQVLEIVGLSPRTLARRKQAGRLSREESDRIARIAVVIDAAEQLFEGHHGNAVAWLKRPVRALGGEVPLQLLMTEAGARDVLDVIGRLEHGVFS